MGKPEDKFEKAAREAIENEKLSNEVDATDEVEEKVSLGNSLTATTDVEPLAKAIVKEEVPEKREYKSLGKAEGMKNAKHDIDDIPNPLGYTELVLENLPSKGKFYPMNTKISIRAARVEEIRDFSTVEETNLFDVDDKLNNILLSCINVNLGGRKGYYKDILEEDRIYIILSIRELTFAQGEHKLTMTAVCDQCDTDNSYELKTTNLQYHDEVENIERYYDEEDRCYHLRTKSAGSFSMTPPTIGVMKQITTYIKKKDEKKEKWDKAFLQILPYMVSDWRGFDDKAIFNENVDFHGWSIDKYNLIFRLAEMMKIGVKSNLIHNCDKCGAEVTVPVTFPGGIKSLFVVQDIAGELL